MFIENDEIILNKIEDMDNSKLKFEISKVKLVTMTVGYILNKFINLNVIFNNLKLNDIIVGIKYNNNYIGKIINKKKKEIKKDFKNQCTLIMHIKWIQNNIVNEKDLNVKLFNNGKIIFTGCTNLAQIKIAMNTIIEVLYNLNGEYECIFDSFKTNYEKEIILNQKMIDYLIEKMNLANEMPELSYLKKKRGAKNKNKYIYKNKTTEEKKTLFNILLLIKIYFTIEDITNDNPEIYDFIDNYIIKETNTYPAYYGNDIKFIYDESKLKILNINSRLKCEMSINRNKIAHLLKQSPLIESVQYDENIYPGVKAIYKNPDPDTNNKNKLAIIIFNSGKINITSTQSLQQINTIYNFIIVFFNNNYDDICIENNNIKKKHIYINNLPNNYFVKIDNVSYNLIKKSHIFKNERNRIIIKNYNTTHYLEDESFLI
jgi:TATA-box binding protein (TBP) (component of TFIID and TFIIIB)